MSENKKRLICGVFLVIGVIIGYLINSNLLSECKKQNSQLILKNPIVVENNLDSIPEKKEVSKKLVKIIVGQFKTNYFFEENMKKLESKGVSAKFKKIKDGSRLIYIELGSITKADAFIELLKLKDSNIIPNDAYLKFY